MRKLASPFVRLLERFQHRLTAARSGSVLILVVALLVLMALLGTAFISTARIDRYGAAQNAANTQIDLLVEGVKNLAIGGIISDLFNGTNVYRPPTEPELGSNYEHNDSYLLDQYFGSRVPTLETYSVGALPTWRSVSWPLVQNGAVTAPYQFDSPAQHTPVQLPAPPVVVGQNYKTEFRFVPSFDTLSGDASFPFLRVFRKRPADANAVEITTGTGIPAADVDGDGIADAGLWKLPMGPIDGITYFAASRIIDNNSAWNGSTAWVENDGTGTANLPGNFFASNINFQAMLANGAAEMNTLNQYRFNDPAATPTASLIPVHDNAPLAQTPTALDDIRFINPAEAMWMQLGRRLEYPGYNAAERYQALPLSDSLALAYKFCIVPPGGAASQIEKLTASYITGAPTQPYQGNELAAWYNTNFAYGAAGFRPLRAITVGRNPVANTRPSYSLQQPNPDPLAREVGFRGGWVAARTYFFGDWVTAPAPNLRPYVCIRPHTSSTTNSPAALAAQGVFWQQVPWGDHPVKANINTAPFGELWHAFFDVMVDRNGDQTYFAPTNSNTTPPVAPVAPSFLAARQFRNPSRDVSITGRIMLNPYQVMLLRSAIAAVNAIDLRDSDSDVTSRDVLLHAGPNLPAATHAVTVYGTERQPYITEVLVDTASPPFIAVELHNPDPTVAIDLTGWRLGTINRTPTAMRPRVVQNVLAPTGMDLGAAVTAATGTATIPPSGYIVLVDGTGAGDVQADMAARGIIPVPIPGMAAAPPALTTAFDRELVVLRTRNASGIPSVAATKPGDSHNEGTDTAPNMGELVPVDQVDFTGISPQTTGGQRIVYRRASVPGGTPATAWHFTHSGPFNPSPPMGIFRHGGMLLAAGDLGNLGLGDTYFGIAPPNSAATYLTRPLQIANNDMAGPRKMYAQLSGPPAATYPAAAGRPPFHFPYGGFARNGDIMQVPFIGAYRILIPGESRETSVRELNSVSMDAVFADDFDPTNDWVPAENGDVSIAREQLGRFCPVGNPQGAAGARGDYEPMPHPLSTTPDPATVRAAYRYQWAMDLFDHLTVQSPGDDYLPDVDNEDVVTTQLPQPPTKMPGAYPAAQPKATANATWSVANDHIGNTPPGATEGKVPMEGLININTASAKVLSALPMVLNAGGTVDQAANDALALAIVNYRDGTPSAVANGPFRSIYDLYKVPAFAARQNLISMNATEPNDAEGDLSPNAAAADGVRHDFEERFLLLNRISNLITTRSDSYVVYLLVQGWQDAGTPTPTLRTQRRLAFIVDRSRIIPANPQATITPVANN